MTLDGPLPASGTAVRHSVGQQVPQRGQQAPLRRVERLERSRERDRRVEGAQPGYRGVQPLERLAALRVDPLDSFRNRVEGLELISVREAGGLGRFLGGRIELFPHQLHTALQATRRDPVRWLLAARTRLLGPGLSPDAIEVLVTDTRVDAEAAAKELGISLTPLEQTLQRSLQPAEAT